MTESTKNDLLTILPTPVTVTIKGEAVPINLIKVGKLAAVMAVLQPIAHLLPKAGAKPEKAQIDFPAIVIQHTPAAIDLVMLLTDKPREWVEDLDMFELVSLLTAIVEVNLDFFIQKVLPSVSVGMEKLVRAFYGLAISKSGQPQSSV